MNHFLSFMEILTRTSPSRPPSFMMNVSLSPLESGFSTIHHPLYVSKDVASKPNIFNIKNDKP